MSKKRQARSGLVRALVLGALALGCAVAGLVWQLRQPLALPAGFEVHVVPGTTLRGLAGELARQDVVPSATLFRLGVRMTGRGGALKAGVYRFDAPVSALALVDKIERGEVSQIAVQFIEGWNLAQLRDTLKQQTALDGDVGQLDNATLMERLGIADAVRELGGDGSHPEGLFFPDTYFVAPHSDAVLLLKRAFTQQRDRLLAAWQTRAPDLPYRTPYQALIMASIIEKETGQAGERPEIAGVFVNRLKRGMRLQTDPTVIYGVAGFDGNLRKKDLLADTPYNTYTRAGLPPTPIAMPGEAAILAALHPAATNALYFVARGDGTHQFSATLAEHNRAVNRYQR